MDQPANAKSGAPILARSWFSGITLAIGIAAIAIVFHREIVAAVEVWNASTAYSHCYLVLPMTGYLLWERRHLLSWHLAQPEFRLALAAVPLTLFWLVAERLGVMEARQLAAVAGVELLLLTVLGRRLFSNISGPLLYLFFLVPFGAFLTPALQRFTAGFSILGLDLLGIPNFSDKFTIETPAGIFFVAEACAGLRFLIASIAFGVFYSLLNYRSLTRRLIFILASIVVPIVANGFRALGIVVLGQVLGSAEAAAADHLVYGWVFFSVVMLLLIAGGHVFRDTGPPCMYREASGSVIPDRSLFYCTLTVVIALGLGPAVAAVIDSTLVVPTLPAVETVMAPAGCSLRSGANLVASNVRVSELVCGGEKFEVRVDAFAARSTSSERIAVRRRITQEIGAENSAASVAEVPDRAGHWTILQTTDPNRVTAFASWVDGQPVTNEVASRVAQAFDSLVGAAYLPALVTITIAEPTNSGPGQRRTILEQMKTVLRSQSGLDSRMVALTRRGVPIEQ